MSYEGTIQILCRNWHLSEEDNNGGWGPDEGSWTCDICGQGAAVWHSVDETNGAEPEEYLQLEPLVPAHCAKCGCQEIVTATWKEKPFEGSYTVGWGGMYK